MPALQFFAVFKAARVVEWKKQAQHYYELCSVAACGVGDAKYNKLVQGKYLERFDTRPKVSPINNEMAGAILTKIFGGPANG